MPTLTADDVLSDLQKLGIISPSEAARARSADPGNPRKMLAAAGLTVFQAETALHGHADRLVLGPYFLLNRVAEGGMGTVYEARHSRLGRIVALKVIRSDKLKSKVVAKRFLREIRMTASLEHPHIVKAYDAGVIGDKIYMATEFVAGCDLASHIRKHGPMPAAEACKTVEHAALALQHIHEHGMVHRDLKPSNLIRDDATGNVKLLDLGLCALPHEGACFDSQSGTITRNGVLLGTPDYLSPEQARDPHSVDIRADLYSLGCTFYFLLSGRPPFMGGAPVDKLMKHLYEPPPPLESPGRTIPITVARIVAKLMAKEPGDRFPTPLALAQTLREVKAAEECEASGENPFAAMTVDPDSLIPQTIAEGPAMFTSARQWYWLIGALATVIISAAVIASNFR